MICYRNNCRLNYDATQINRALEGPQKGEISSNIKLSLKDLEKNSNINSILTVRDSVHPAGDVTRVSVMPRKITVKIGDAENQCR